MGDDVGQQVGVLRDRDLDDDVDAGGGDLADAGGGVVRAVVDDVVGAGGRGQRKADDAEKLIAKLIRERQALETRMADPVLYNGPADKVTKLQKDLGDVQKKLAAAEDAWMEAHEALEAAESEATGAV